MMIFEKEYELRGSDFDRFDRIRPAAVLDLFQDVAGIHAVELGVGFHDLIAREMIWVLTKIRYEIVGELRRYERVRVRTWPLPPSRVNCRREYRIEAMDGAVLVNGTSEWVIVHNENLCVHHSRCLLLSFHISLMIRFYHTMSMGILCESLLNFCRIFLLRLCN